MILAIIIKFKMLNATLGLHWKTCKKKVNNF